MRTLQSINMTPEQLAIFSRNQPGVELIRGAAGSGKTTTALLKLKAQIAAYVNRRKRSTPTEPIHVLVLTYNRTLRGYVEHLARQQIAANANVIMEIDTFASWAKNRLGVYSIHSDKGAKITSLGKGIPLEPDFLTNEVDYLLGRFLPSDMQRYLVARRVGRGAVPRVDRSLREAILAQVVTPYSEWKDRLAKVDWNDLAVQLATRKTKPLYDIVVADETQDFSANQIRAILNQLLTDSSTTFVLDSTQRIYPRGFQWSEVGVELRPEQSRRLKKNYRNTKQVARLAADLVAGLTVDDDGTIPDPESCALNGEKPSLIIGKFSEQLAFAIKKIKEQVDLQNESVVFLHPLGWFGEVRRRLSAARLPFVELTRESEWPDGPENIGLSTLHSAKGLEFDHVIILGINSEVTSHGDDDDDDQLHTLRRLFAMGIGRAKRTVVLGYKDSEASDLIKLIEPEHVEKINL